MSIAHNFLLPFGFELSPLVALAMLVAVSELGDACSPESTITLGRAASSNADG